MNSHNAANTSTPDFFTWPKGGVELANGAHLSSTQKDIVSEGSEYLNRKNLIQKHRDKIAAEKDRIKNRRKKGLLTTLLEIQYLFLLNLYELKDDENYNEEQQTWATQQISWLKEEAALYRAIEKELGITTYKMLSFEIVTQASAASKNTKKKTDNSQKNNPTPGSLNRWKEQFQSHPNFVRTLTKIENAKTDTINLDAIKNLLLTILAFFPALKTNPKTEIEILLACINLFETFEQSKHDILIKKIVPEIIFTWAQGKDKQSKTDVLEMLPLTWSKIYWEREYYLNQIINLAIHDPFQIYKTELRQYDKDIIVILDELWKEALRPLNSDYTIAENLLERLIKHFNNIKTINHFTQIRILIYSINQFFSSCTTEKLSSLIRYWARNCDTLPSNDARSLRCLFLENINNNYEGNKLKEAIIEVDCAGGYIETAKQLLDKISLNENKMLKVEVYHEHHEFLVDRLLEFGPVRRIIRNMTYAIMASNQTEKLHQWLKYIDDHHNRHIKTIRVEVGCIYLNINLIDAYNYFDFLPARSLADIFTEMIRRLCRSESYIIVHKFLAYIKEKHKVYYWFTVNYFNALYQERYKTSLASNELNNLIDQEVQFYLILEKTFSTTKHLAFNFEDSTHLAKNIFETFHLLRKAKIESASDQIIENLFYKMIGQFREIKTLFSLSEVELLSTCLKLFNIKTPIIADIIYYWAKTNDPLSASYAQSVAPRFN